jgi:hypothetical protein
MKSQQYRVEMAGSWWTRSPQAILGSIQECRDWAASFGSDANEARIYREHGKKIVAMHVRSTAGNGLRWFKARV